MAQSNNLKFDTKADKDKITNIELLSIFGLTPLKLLTLCLKGGFFGEVATF